MNRTITGTVLRGSAALMVIVLLLAISSTALAQSVQVPATAGWVNTGIAIQQGQILTVTATGSVMTLASEPTTASGPDGQAVPCPNPNTPDLAGVQCLLTGAPYGGLVGRIGDGAPFKVGANYRAAAPGSGTLFLGVNDHATGEAAADNQGAFDVQVAVAPAGSDWCVSPDGVTKIGCAEITISPAGLTGDFYLKDTLLVKGQNPGRVILPPGNQRVDVRNIVSTEAGYGVLFVYNDAQAFVYVRENQVGKTTVYPTKKFIRGTLALTCDIRNTTPADVLGCSVTIDGVVQPDVLGIGAKRNYILDPGPHTVSVAITGAQSSLWAPATRDSKPNITAGRTTTISARFEKAGHLFINNNQPGVLADYYVDGKLVATQVAATDLWVEPNKSHRVEAKNYTDPAAQGVWKFNDSSTFAFLSPGQSRTVTFRPTKVYLMGFLALTCKFEGLSPGENVYCVPRVDGVVLASVAPDATVTYPLMPGNHELMVTVGPEDQFTSDPQVFQIRIYAGQTVRKTVTWEREEEAPPPPPPGPVATPVPPTGGGMGTIAAVNMSTTNATCRVAINGNGGSWLLDAPNSIQLQPNSYGIQIFIGNKQSNGFAIRLDAGETCVYYCFDEFWSSNCLN